MNRKQHWESIYQTKAPYAFSWYQEKPHTSLSILDQLRVHHTAKIIDIGGGDSTFADHLLDRGYQNITVLDISASAIERAQRRLGERASKITWIVADAAQFKPTMAYDFWHDRAAFHFLTDEQEVSNYIQAAQQGIVPGGILVIGTFSEKGPTQCSGIEVKRYSARTMTNRLEGFFKKIKCLTTEHLTPFQTVQQFVFCSFKKLSI
ncbi:class I SAM-dependent methyltransferase [Niabella sp. CC-SYL272]|uniref:class I SAM-dependent methyltransferase n=1 Tax=Niabella agricola TaxID=2891571 RepID=UPI001F18AB54|nr:class I SAM-dependent methyltransferase [Niabella agricola]MCF3108223.1 class I SAM-dependent methyltransferase [Niabella agricola]